MKCRARRAVRRRVSDAEVIMRPLNADTGENGEEELPRRFLERWAERL